MRLEVLTLIVLAILLAFASLALPQEARSPIEGVADSEYVLGPGDELIVTVVGLKELPGTAVRVNSEGDLSLPLVGTLRVTGKTARETEEAITSRLGEIMQAPLVSVRVNDYQSQPVSVIGAVATPGVKQVVGRKTLLEMLSLAGGLKVDAGFQVKVVRRLKWGPIPLPEAHTTFDGAYSVVQINLRELMDGSNPQENILIRPQDVISVPNAELVYVLGEVRKAGGFVLREKEKMSVLQAIALAEGLERTASPTKARILRKAGGTAQQRAEIILDLQKILDGKSEDVSLLAGDILVVPSNVPRKVALRALETAVQLGTGVVIWRR